MTDFLLDTARPERIGLPEAIYCAGKTPAQIAAIIDAAPGPLLLTRLDAARHASVAALLATRLDYDPLSATAIHGDPPAPSGPARIAIVTAGTSDIPAAREAARTLAFSGVPAAEFNDLGVAGLWRILSRLDELRTYEILLVAAGMDAALPSVVAGLVAAPIVAIPTSVGYGVAAGGQTALNAVLASCAPGIATVNIDNGYGAACAALRILRRPAHATP